MKKKVIIWIIIGAILAGTIAVATSYYITSHLKENQPDVTATPSNAGYIPGENYIADTNPFSSVDLPDLGEIKLVDYSNVEVTLDTGSTEITEESVDKYIQAEQTDSLVDVTDRPAQDGDTLTVDFVGTIDGEEMENGTKNDFVFTVGGGEMLSDFENAVKGANLGETITATVAFPEDYVISDIAGKTAIYKITVKEIQENPAFDEAYIKEHSKTGATTEAEYRAEVRKILEDYVISSNRQEAITKAITKIADESTLTPSSAFMDYLYGYYYNNMVQVLSQSGYTVDEYMSATNQTDQQITEDINNMVESNVRQIMVLRQIAKDQNLDDLSLQKKELVKYMKNFLNDDVTENELDELYGNQVEMMGLQAAVYNYMDDHVTVVSE